MTYNGIYDKIAEVLNAQKIIEKSILYTEVESNVGGNFLNIKYPDDPTIRAILQGAKTFIDAQNSFTLLNQNAVATGGVTPGYLQQAIYFKKNPGDSSSWWVTGYGSPGSNDYASPFWHPTTTYPADGHSPSSNTHWLQSTIRPDETGTYLKGYLRSFGWADGQGSSDPFETRYFDISGYYPNDVSAGGNFKIDYSGLPTENIEISITAETYNDADTNPDANLREEIDRKVAFRTTEKTAGPFGSLNPFLTLSTENSVIHDSKYPKLDLNVVPSINLTSAGFPQGWLLDGLEDKYESFILNDVKITLGADGDPNYEGDYEATFIQDGLPIVNTSLMPDDSDTEWTFGESSDGSTNWPNPIQNRNMNVTNYVQKEFGGNRDYTKKTGTDLVLGFGNNPSGRHTVRPAIYKYEAFRSNDENNLIVDQESSLVIESVLDPPRGVRFGLWNTSPSKTTYKFSSRSYGNFRDMLEQALDTRFSDTASDEILGSPVFVNSVQPMNPTLPLAFSDSKRYNKTPHATITVPFIDRDGTSTPNPTNINSPSVRVDVPGRIRLRQTTGPGNLSASIFRRS